MKTPDFEAQAREFMQAKADAGHPVDRADITALSRRIWDEAVEAAAGILRKRFPESEGVCCERTREHAEYEIRALKTGGTDA